MTLHPLLVRLLRTAGLREDETPSLAAWQAMLQLVSRTYREADQDRELLERSIEISSREMQGLYQDLKRRSADEIAAEHQRAEQSLAILRATLEATLEAIIVVDSQRRVVAANRRYQEMANTPPELVASGDHRAMIEHVVKGYPDPDLARAEIEEIHSSNEIWHDERPLSDGRIIDRYSAPVSLPDGKEAGRVTFLRDVTIERRARAELERAREAAESASQAKTMFLANISHELRTPLNAVIGLADLLLIEGGEPVTARQRQYLEGVAQSGRHLLAMVDDVLDLAKIEAGKHSLALGHVGPATAIEEAVALLKPLANHRGVALIAEVDPHVPELRADPLRFKQILYNLISNAVKFTDRDGKVRVSALADSRGVAIRVADTGIGIAPENITRLFRAFEQLDLPTGQRPVGTGLGLALTKRLVDMHGGTIDVVSRLGAGTTFTVRLPVA